MDVLTIPFCSQCFREVVNFDCFVETPCKHCYCWKCITGRRDCPIDHTAWDPQSMVYSDELKEAVETFSARKTNANLEKVYELINVNGVECRLAGNRKHNSTLCHYHHPAAKVDNSLESWECLNCKITVSAQSQMCGFCNCLKPSVSADGQEWTCAQCTALNSMETYVCSVCAKTSTEIRSLLRTQGKNMKLCPKCKKRVPVTQTCTFCATPIIDPALNPNAPYWTCSNCGSKCQQMDSWICDKCAKTDIPQRQKLCNEGKEMNHCPSCKKLVPCSLTQCWSCYVLIPWKCGVCGTTGTSEKCENCETRRQTQSSHSLASIVTTHSAERNPSSQIGSLIPIPEIQAKPISSGNEAYHESSQVWACAYCTTLNSTDTYVCSSCRNINDEIRTLLAIQSKNMKLCPKCKIQVPFIQTCTFCATPIIDPALNPNAPYWTCSNCGSKCQQMDSWICDKCAKTDIPQWEKLCSEGKEMNHCPSCKKLVPCSLTQCWSCYVLIPRKCGACGSSVTSEKCENCETSRQTRSSRSPAPRVATHSTERNPDLPISTFNSVPVRQAKPISSIAQADESSQVWVCAQCSTRNSMETYVCSACGKVNNEIYTYLKSQGKVMELCPNCRNEVPISNQICTFCATPIIDPALNPTGPYWTCSNCGSKCQQMDSWICDNCATPDIPQRQKLRNEEKEMNPCPSCKKLVTYNRYQCDSCSALVPRRCGACGLDYSAEKCDNCEARRQQRSSRSPKPRTSEKLHLDPLVSVMKHPNPPSERREYTQPVSRGRENPVEDSENQFFTQRQNPAPIYSEPLFSGCNYPATAHNRHRGDGSIENMRRGDSARNIDAPMYDRSGVAIREALPDNRIVPLLVALVLAFLFYNLFIGKSQS